MSIHFLEMTGVAFENRELCWIISLTVFSNATKPTKPVWPVKRDTEQSRASHAQ